jgi:hypothetical protein
VTTANMNILYKYCDQVGIVKILESLELKLPYISEVNDPLECLPVFYCPDNKSAIEARYLSVLNRKKIRPPEGYTQALNELYEKGEIQKELAESSLKCQKNLNQKSCLLSVSKTARNTVMWAHYANKHKGAIIGIDFNKVFFEINRVIGGLKLNKVKYSEQRPKINILTDFVEPPYAFLKTILTKSIEWKYEREFRTVFFVDTLENLRKQGLACLKDFNCKKTWFLRLNPESIREIIFGLYTEESLKLAIRKLIERPELQHVKLYQAKESETYTLNLIDLES